MEIGIMTLPSWHRISKTRSHHRQASPKTNLPAAQKISAIKLALEPLEDRLTPSGFGSADGAYLVEPWSGYYSDVKIQPADQKIDVAGTVNGSGGVSASVALARYDSAGNPDSSFGTSGLSVPHGIGFQAGGLVLQPDGKAVVSANVS